MGFCKDVWWKTASSEAKESMRVLTTEEMGDKQVTAMERQVVQ